MHKQSVRIKVGISIVAAIVFSLSFIPATIAGAAQIRVAWNPVLYPAVIGYKVYYGTSSRHYQTVCDAQNNLYYQITGITEGQKYYIAITAYTIDAESGYSYELTYPPQLDARSFAPILSLLMDEDINYGAGSSTFSGSAARSMSW